MWFPLHVGLRGLSRLARGMLCGNERPPARCKAINVCSGSAVAASLAGGHRLAPRPRGAAMTDGCQRWGKVRSTHGRARRPRARSQGQASTPARARGRTCSSSARQSCRTSAGGSSTRASCARSARRASRSRTASWPATLAARSRRSPPRPATRAMSACCTSSTGSEVPRPGPPPACHARPAQTRRCWFSGSLQQLTAPARHPGLTRACLACLRFCTSGRARRAERCSGRRAHAGGARRAEVRYLGGLALHVQGNFVMQNLLHAAAKLRGAAALLRARGGTPDAELARLVGAGVGGTDAFGAPPASGLSAFPFSWRGGWQNSAWVRSPSGV